MSLPPLTIIPAGAGSGKTYTIEQRLGEWVSKKLVEPRKIVAVTFTEAAAAELRQRIRGRLVALDRLDDAIALDQAYVSTIHGFGSRLLQEFSFENGSSPSPRLLDDDEEDVLLRQAIAQTDRVAAITRDLRRYGYVFQFGAERTPEEAFREDVLEFINLLRTMAWTGFETHYAERVGEWISEEYGETVDGGKLTERLRRAVKRLLNDFPHSLENLFQGNQKATTELRRDFRNLNGVLLPGRIQSDWTAWKQLGELRGSNSRCALPDGYDSRADTVREIASELPRHPGPRDSAIEHVAALIDAAQDVLEQYARAKREAGLVDYTDMIALTNRLLAENSEMLETLRDRIDCLVVDEFQDTNPLQFALLWHLHQAGVPTLVVGDLKQAIMGFQGADPRLFEAIQGRYPKACDPLTSNWRSQPAIMDFVNALGPRLFPDAYTPLEPRTRKSRLAPLEVVRFTARPRKDGHYLRALALGRCLGRLLEDDQQQVRDKQSGRLRQLRGSDMAVLCPTHKILEAYASAFRELGFAVRREEPGWYASRAVRLALDALAYVANPKDRHAALSLEVTELGSMTLEQGISALIKADGLSTPLLERLDAVAAHTAERTVYSLVAETLAAIQLHDVITTWPDARQHRANLLRLQAEAGAFMDTQREALAYGGFHGSGLPTFLAWLNVRASRDDCKPPAAVLDEHAIELVTWHSAKGREWPVVAVGGLDQAVKGRLPNAALAYESFDDLEHLLETASIEYSPAFAAKETNERFLEPLNADAQREERRLLYVALTRARDKLVIEWPEYLAGKGKQTSWNILADACGLALDDNALVLGEQRFKCVAHVASLDDEVEVEDECAPLIEWGRRAIRCTPDTVQRTPDSVAASSLDEATARAADAPPSYRYADAPALGGYGAGSAVGTRLHRCFEVLGARPQLDRCVPEILGVDADDPVAATVVTQVAHFESWLKTTWPNAEFFREWPVLARRDDGAVVTGAIDVLVRCGDDAWVIDHKSDQIEAGNGTAAKYRAQLEAYGMCLDTLGMRVRGLGINWIRTGQVLFLSGDVP